MLGVEHGPRIEAEWVTFQLLNVAMDNGTFSLIIYLGQSKMGRN